MLLHRQEVYALFPDVVGRKTLRIVQMKVWRAVNFRSISLEDEGCRCYLLGLATDVKIEPSPLPIRIHYLLWVCAPYPI